MKKKFVLIAFVAAFGLASCTTIKKTASTIDVNNSLTSNSDVELIVADKQISHNHRVTAKERRGGTKNVYNAAVSAALKANGNADVLVAPEYETVIKKGLFGKKIKEVMVSGYPAKYKNFK